LKNDPLFRQPSTGAGRTGEGGFPFVVSLSSHRTCSADFGSTTLVSQ